MKDERRNHVRTGVSSRLLTVGLVCLVVLFGWLVIGEVIVHHELRSSMRFVQSRYEEALKKRGELERILALIERPEFIEVEAKRKLNKKRAGERVFVVGARESDHRQEILPSRESKARVREWFEFLGF